MDNTFRLWDLTVADPVETVRILRGHEGGPGDRYLAFSPDGRWLVTACRRDPIPRLWDLTIEDPAATSIVLRSRAGPIRTPTGIALRADADPITSVAISDDGHWLVTRTDDDSLLAWDLTVENPSRTATESIPSGPLVYEPIRNPAPSGMNSLSFNSRWLVTWERKAGNVFDSVLRDQSDDQPGESSRVLYTGRANPKPTYSRDNRWLLTNGPNGNALIWKLGADVSEAISWELRDHAVRYAAFSADGTALATTGTTDGTIRLWDLTAEDPGAASVVLGGLEGTFRTVAINTDGRWLFTSAPGGNALLWNFGAGTSEAQTWELRGRSNTRGAFSSDSKMLVTFSASIGTDGTIRVWDLTAEDPAATSVALHGHKRNLQFATTNPDGRWLVTLSADGTVRLWHLRMDDLLEMARRRAGRELTAEERETYYLPATVQRGTDR
jgi:WD40 repeat protein